MYKTTLDQWLVFKTVAEKKGFSAAANVLNKSQSTISYSIAKLQEQLNVKLIHVQGKRCELTLSGRNLLRKANTVLNHFEELELTANYLSIGVESNITLAVDSIFPKKILFAAISEFSKKFPYTQINIEESFRLTPRDSHNFDMAVGVSKGGIVPGPKLLEVTMIPVAHKNHAVFRLNKSCISKSDLCAFKQIFYQNLLCHDVENASNSPQNIWLVQSIESALSAIEANLCYGWLPKHNVIDQLANGIFKEIPLDDDSICGIPLYLVENQVSYKGVAFQFLRKTLMAHSVKVIENTHKSL